MGANAVTTVPVYTAGEVLTAADMNITNSGIPVFATTVTRDAAFGGAGEKTLAEGQFAYIEASNTTQYYDGSAWQPVGTTPGLTFITGATFTTATSVSLPNGTFNATYKNYRIMFSLTASTGSITIGTRFRNAGTDNTAANYFQNSFIVGGTNIVTDNAATSFNFGGADSLAIYSVSLDVWSPNVSSDEHAITGLTTFYVTTPTGGTRNAYHYNATPQTFDSFSFISNTASSMTGFYRVYGYSES